MYSDEPGPSVFLHGLWRSATTYVWTRFRETPGTYCFYEPLYDGLSKLTPGRIERNGGSDPNALRHPTLSAPYFAEFAPLLGLRGVRGFDRRFAYDRMVLEAQDEHPGLERYIAGLIGFAVGQGRTPVLGFVRTCWRVAWLKRRFAARHIYIDRSPEEICASYLDQRARGNPWFIANWLWVIERNRDCELLAPLAERLPLRRGVQRLIPRKPFYLAATREMDAARTYFMTLYAWLASLALGAAQSDYILDVDQLQLPSYRDEAIDNLRRLAGLPLQFPDVRLLQRETPLGRAQLRRIEREVMAAFPREAVRSGAPLAQVRAALPMISPRKSELAAALI